MPSGADDGAQYSFAIEYKGPPVNFDLPRAVPINVDRIPVAAVVGPVSLPEKLTLPVVQPVLAPKTFSKELKKSTVSPTSVFDRSSEDDTKELEGSESTVSPTSVIGFEERVVESGVGCALSGELSSSGALEFSNGLNYRSGEFSDVNNGGKESLDLNSDSNQPEPDPDWALTESVLSLDYPSSRVSSSKALDCDVRRPPLVTFRDIESDDGVDEEEAEVVQAKREPQSKGKKKTCYRCFKGTRFTEKEVCIVCDANDAMPSGADDGAQYSFAIEYKGPPVNYDLPRAVPINVDRIPVAAVVGPVSLPEKLTLAVVQPVLAPKTFSKELKKSTVSPTSVFDRSSEDDTKELEGSESTVSPTSVIGFEERVVESGVGCALSGELSSSGALEFSNGLNYRSGEFSDVNNGGKESLDFNSDSNQPEPDPDWASTESVLSLDYPSSRVSSSKALDCDVRRPPLVTFRDIESDDGVDEEEAEVVQAKREPQSKGKKKTCYRCFKGTRFTEKEVCIVCDAKYCSSCVLRAMGSMPEGRKCVTCIGFPIDESKRGSLGKCSRMLKRLLNDLEVRQVMKAEKFCEANQLPADYICVNGQPLCHEELVILQTCPNPPKKLKPGNYWYDKVSGLWGKEGQKPSKIISPHLSVGGPIKTNASNGNTQVYINGREITKVELRMLQLAGVQCAGNPHFWVNEDGSYQEEGQKNTKGYIWGKAGTKLVCAVLSLPVPSKSSNPCGEPLNYVGTRVVPDYIEQRILQKILLVGYNGSGTSTIFKQAKILYKAIPFLEDERENIKFTIQSNVYGYLGILLEGRERFEEECLDEMRKQCSSSQTDANGNNNKTLYSIGPRLKAFSDWLLKTMVSGNLEAIFPAATREYAPLVEELWKDSAIQATYKRRSELEMLPSVATYFLERAVDILRIDYEPSDLDILYAEGVTSSNGLACVDFSFPHSASEDSINTSDPHDSLLRYQLIRVNARGLGENCKWLEMFEDVGMVIFCVSLSDYDQFSADGNGSFTNKMLLSRTFFESIVTHPTFEQMDFLLILNKFDLFGEKVERVPLNQCVWFDDFHPVITRHRSNSNTSSNNINSSPSLGHLASHYIAAKFKRLYSSLTGKKLYASVVKGLQPDSVDTALKYSREILKWDEERANFSFDYSVYSTEASSFSH